MSPRLLVVALALSLVGVGCSAPKHQDDPCRGVTCSFHGVCITEGVLPYCLCEPGYHPEAFECVVNDLGDPCEGVDCSGRGVCVAEEDLPSCLCVPGFEPDESGMQCVGDVYRECVMDGDCLDGGGRFAMDLATSECVDTQRCDELWKCAAGPTSGCGGGVLDCRLSPGCPEGVQGCRSGACELLSTCDDRIKFPSRSESSTSCEPNENQCNCRYD